MSGRRCSNPGCKHEAPPTWECDRCDRPLCVDCDRLGAGLCMGCAARLAGGAA